MKKNFKTKKKTNLYKHFKVYFSSKLLQLMLYYTHNNLNYISKPTWFKILKSIENLHINFKLKRLQKCKKQKKNYTRK